MFEDCPLGNSEKMNPYISIPNIPKSMYLGFILTGISNNNRKVMVSFGFRKQKKVKLPITKAEAPISWDWLPWLNISQQIEPKNTLHEIRK